MKNLPLIEVTELIKGIESSDNFQDDLSIADLNGDLINYEEKRLEHSTPMRLNALLMILVQEGTADISVDYIPYKIEKNTFITLMPTHIIQVSKVSKDLRGRLLFVSRSFLDGYTTPAGKKNSMVHYMQIRKNPCAAMSAEETEHISGQFSILREKMKLRTHFFQKEALQNALVGFFIELANIFMGKNDGTYTLPEGGAFRAVPAIAFRALQGAARRYFLCREIIYYPTVSFAYLERANG